MENKSLYCLIMAGGVGSRFWPLSTEEQPKQFLDFLGTGKSLLQMTFDRFQNIVPRENIYILTNASYEGKVVEQLQIPNNQVICEPIRKNTAPCIAFATAKILNRDPEATMIVTPSDHLITNEKQFDQDIELGIHTARNKESLITFGISPHRPDTGYGYIEFDNSKKEESVQHVQQFREKPDLKTAEEFLNAGNFYWNSGMFIWRGSVLKDSFQQHCESLYNLFFKNPSQYNSNQESAFCQLAFENSESISIDYAILEKEAKVEVVLSKFGWSDLGTWGSIKEIASKDENGSSSNHEKIHLFNSNNCFVHSEKEKTVLIDGLQNYIVIDTPDKLMILKEENEQKLKEYLTKIRPKSS